jgi:hypothetical protein
LDYGTALNPIKFSGAVSADFLLYNNDTIASVSVSAVENIPLDGNYTLTYIAQTGDSLTLSVTKSGFDGELTYVGV